jgi:ribosomal protein L16 Arg81 hydroxylase
MSTLLEVDHGAFARAYPVRPCGVKHRLADHPLLTLESLAELADRMPASSAERHLADQPLVKPGGSPDIEGSPAETIRTIETNGYWMVLWNIEDDPLYAKLMNDFLDEVEQTIPLRKGEMRNRQAFVFLSAPNATTPVHIDPEHNFLLQIRGIKEMNVGEWRDAKHESSELERYYGGGHRNLDALPDKVETFRMDPGDGTYVPSFAPHFVKNMDNVSVSLSITFRTRASERNENVHRFNSRLRKKGRHPREVGQMAMLDRGKAFVVHARDRMRGKAVGRREK